MFGFGKKQESKERKEFREEFEKTISVLHRAPEANQVAVGYAINLANSIFSQAFGSAENFSRCSTEEKSAYIKKMTETEVSLREKKKDELSSIGFGLFKMWLGAVMANDVELKQKFSAELAYFSRKAP